ncbi:MAG TPA: hypothetical protein VL359_06855, partial [bacterium]|nr:hypothetical protein [bacterium]
MARGLIAVVSLCLLVGAAAHPQGVAVFPPQAGESSGQAELQALAAAYPDRITEAAQRDGDWAVQVDGRWFFWAHGRILPESQRADWEKYARFRFYTDAPG